MILFKTKGREASFSEVCEPALDLLDQSIFAIYDEIVDGFKDGEIGLMNWVKANIMRLVTEGLAPNQMMMGQMKGNMIFGKL